MFYVILFSPPELCLVALLVTYNIPKKILSMRLLVFMMIFKFLSHLPKS